MEGLEVGDRVIANGKMSGTDMTGMIGTIRGVNSHEYNVEFDKPVPGNSGHVINGLIPQERRAYGYNMYIKLVDLYKKPNIFLTYISDKFKGRRVSVTQNGNTFKLVTTTGKMLYTYIATKDLERVVETKNKTEMLYQKLFKDAINEYNASKSEEV